MNKTSIEWTHRPETRGAAGGMTWNPIRARRTDAQNFDKRGMLKDITGTFCTRISPGCTHCYASSINKRFGNGLEFTVPNLEKIEFFIDERILQEPLRTRKPCTIFAGDMNDIFHEAIPFSLIAQVMKVACGANWHTFQFLTKRANRMREFFAEWDSMTRDFGPLWPYMWPRPHIWLGISVEDQQRADERIPLLLQTPAAVRFLSVEPQLEAVDLKPFLFADPQRTNWARLNRIHQVIVGGESGPGARPFNLSWAESLQAQCKAAGVAYFLKQIGSNPWWTSEEALKVSNRYRTDDRKGGDPSEWPEHLRVREFPTVKEAKDILQSIAVG